MEAENKKIIPYWVELIYIIEGYLKIFYFISIFVSPIT